MNSLEWRIKKLEDKVLGQTGGFAYFGKSDRDNVISQLESIAKAFKEFQSTSGSEYEKFNDLYQKYKGILASIETLDTARWAKERLVLAYEDDLVKHMEDTASLTERADKVLDIQKWPDMRDVTGRLENLQKITKEQHLQSLKIDRGTEELIELYNDIITSFKNNMIIWNQKLDGYESIEKKLDEDE